MSHDAHFISQYYAAGQTCPSSPARMSWLLTARTTQIIFSAGIFKRDSPMESRSKNQGGRKLRVVTLKAVAEHVGLTPRGEALSKKELVKQRPPEIDPDLSATTCAAPSETCITAGSTGLKPQHFYLAYIEFDDMGELWSFGDLNPNDAKPSPTKQSQLETAIITIRTAKEKAAILNTELVVVAFIHGWHNNASV